MKLRFRLCIPALALCLGALVSAPALAVPVLYTISSDGTITDDQLRMVNPFTAATLSGVSITLAGETVLGGTGLATNPLTNELYAILKLNGQSGRELVKINPLTGVATSIGNTGRNFAGLAFDAAGVLYGVTGESGRTPTTTAETLFVISLTNASSTLKLALGAGDDGEAIAFNPADGQLYHASGNTGDCDIARVAGVCLEKIDLTTLAITPVEINGTALTIQTTQALAYWDSQGVFLWKQDHGPDAPLYRVTAAGVSTMIGDLDHQAKGLAFVDVAAVVPEPGSLALLGLGLAALAQRRRREP